MLRECYRRKLENHTLEEVEIVALSVLPAPEDDSSTAQARLEREKKIDRQGRSPVQNEDAWRERVP